MVTFEGPLGFMEAEAQRKIYYVHSTQLTSSLPRSAYIFSRVCMFRMLNLLALYLHFTMPFNFCTRAYLTITYYTL